MKAYLISDTHFNHAKIATYCDRPADFTETIIRRWQSTITDADVVIHLGDVFIGPVEGWRHIWPQLTGRKILVRGNHDRRHSLTWWMENGFDGAVDSMIFRKMWLTHEPAKSLPEGCELNVHGHLHNIWHGFRPEGLPVEKKLHNEWQRLFSVEYTDYRPVDFEKFIRYPDKFKARGLV